MGCGLIVASIPLAKASELRVGHLAIDAEVIVISQISAILATLASVAIEVSF